MKQLKKIVGFCLLALNFGICSNVNAEYVHSGDYTTPGIFDGDLVIIDGNLHLKHSFTIHNDIKIISGKVIVASDNAASTTVDLYVYGDLIVTNTENSGEIDATIDVQTGRLIVMGEIFTRSKNGQAFVKGEYGISAGKIHTNGALDAGVITDTGSIIVEGDIVTKSGTDGKVRAGSGDVDPPASYDIKAAYISTNGAGETSAYVEADGSIEVGGGIVTKSEYGPAYVKAATKSDGGIRADYIFTNGYGDSRIESGSGSTIGFVDVAGDIVTNSVDNDAYVSAEGHILAGNISTSADQNAFVHSSKQIDVDGDIITRSTSNDADVKSTQENIKAKSISTKAAGDAYIDAETGLDVKEAIVTNGVSSGYVQAINGSVNAGSIKTASSSGPANILVGLGSIDVKGTINTNGWSSSYVSAVDFIKAENIYTVAESGGIAAILCSDGPIEVKDVISTKNSAVHAYVEASTDISAHAIRTDGGLDSYIKSETGSINVVEDISTKSNGGNAYVWATQGNINAQKIRTEAPTGQDDSIKAMAGSGHFQFVLNELDVAKTFSNCEFDLDFDRELNTVLTLVGTCTINGKGNQLNFGANGGIVVGDGVLDSQLWLNNIEINRVSGEKIKCATNDDTLWMHNVVWRQSGDSAFKNGVMKVSGDTAIFGPSTKFSYETSGVSQILKDATLSFGPKVIVDYKSSAINGFAMLDETSRLNFNDATLNAIQDIRFIKGTLVIDNDVTFNASAARTVYFGNGVFANNINFEYHVDSQLDIAGDGSFVNANV